MFKKLVKWTGCLSCCVLAVTSIYAEDQNPNTVSDTSKTQAKTQVEEVQPPATDAPASETEKPQIDIPVVVAKPAPEVRKIGELTWHTDYAAAYLQAKEEHKQLLLFFRSEKDLLTAGQLEQNGLARPELREPLSKFVRVVLFTSAVTPLAKDAKADAKPARLLDHTCFAHMQKQAGLAIVDLLDSKDHLFGKCVSAHPFSSNTLGSVAAIKIMLELPRGTITQRTLTFVMRTHPERPASVWGQGNPFLFEQARHASQLMVNTGSVGHHDWGNRSSYIMGQFGSGPSEVASMGWGNNLFEAAHACVNLWRGSSTHWSMMITPNRFFGYDMVQSPNGTWYANGLFVQ